MADVPDIPAFIQQWGLNDVSFNLLVAQELEVQQLIVNGFSPKHNTSDMDKLFGGYVRSIETRRAAGQGRTSKNFTPNDPAACQNFIMEKGMEQVCLDELLSLAPHQRSQVMERFDPSRANGNPTGLFLGFVRSVKAANPSATNSSDSGKGGGKGFSPETMLKWCEQKNLDQPCLDALLALSQEAAQHVMANFAPQPHTRNPAGLFMSFIRSLSGANFVPGKGKNDDQTQEHQESMLNWCALAGLDQTCLDSLLALTYAQQIKVMDTFQPMEDTRNPTGRFLSYIRGPAIAGAKEWTPGKGSKGGSGDSWHQSGGQHVAIEDAPATAADLHACKDWCEKGGLNQECLDLLISMSVLQQKEVMLKFAPRGDTRDPARLFLRYAQSVKSGWTGESPAKGWGGKGKSGKGAEGYGFSQAQAPQGSPLDPSFYEMLETSDPSGLQAPWIEQMGLDQICMDTLLAMTPEDQITVMKTFAPRPGTRNPVGLFLNFARSIREAGGKGPPPKGAGREGTAPTTWWQREAVAKNGGQSWGQGGGATAIGAAPTSDPVSWCASHGLDQLCLDTLLGLPYGKQQEVMDGYKPNTDTRNPVGRFLSFARSVASGGPPGYMKGHGKGADQWQQPIGAGGWQQPIGAGGWNVTAHHTPRVVPAKRPASGMKEEDREPPSSEAIVDFTGNWGLDDECVVALMEAPTEVQLDVMAGFSPKPDTHNVKNLFMSYINSRTAAIDIKRARQF